MNDGIVKTVGWFGKAWYSNLVSAIGNQVVLAMNGTFGQKITQYPVRILKHMRKPIAFIGALALFGAISLPADHHAKAPEFVGEWLATGEMPDGGESKSTIAIAKKDGKLTAVLTTENGEEMPLDRVKTEGKKLTLEVDMENDGQSGTVGASGSLNDNGEVVGKWYMKGSDGTDYGSADWKAVRSLKSMLTGNWNAVGKTDEGDLEHEAVFSKSGGKFQGYLSSNDGDIDLENLKIDENMMTFQLPYLEGTLKFKISPRSASKLVGKWTFFDSSDFEAASGEWVATKAKASN